MPTIRLEAVRFHYDSPYALVFANPEGVNLQLETRWRAGLVAPNGRGKTTLLALICGDVQPQQGSVSTPVHTTRFPAGRPDPALPTRELVRESIAPYAAWEARMRALLARADEPSLEAYGELALAYEHHDGYRIAERIEREWPTMGLHENLLDRPFGTLSGGEQTRALVLALFLGPDRYPLIDEPTNHLDREGRALLGAYLARKPGFLLASHDRAFLDSCVDHIVSIDRSGLHVARGRYSEWREQERRKDEHEARERTRLAREVKSLEDAARSRRTWSDRREKDKNTGHADRGFEGHRAAKLMKRALHVQQRADQKLEEKRALLRRPQKRYTLKLGRERPGRGVLLDAEQISLEVESRTLLSGLSLRVQPRDRIAVVGPNGCGKTLLLDTLAGKRAPADGRIHRLSQLRILRAFQVPRWREGRLGDRLDEEGIEETHFRNVLGAMGVQGDVFDRPLESFSEGERKKVDLCRSFLEPADLLIWDEPLNYLDIRSREQIEEVVLEYQPSLVFVEHDEVFVSRIATRIIDLSRARAGDEAPLVEDV